MSRVANTFCSFSCVLEISGPPASSGGLTMEIPTGMHGTLYSDEPMLFYNTLGADFPVGSFVFCQGTLRPDRSLQRSYIPSTPNGPFDDDADFDSAPLSPHKMPVLVLLPSHPGNPDTDRRYLKRCPHAAPQTLAFQGTVIRFGGAMNRVHYDFRVVTYSNYHSVADTRHFCARVKFHLPFMSLPPAASASF
ncbi:hypothetical protein V8E54_005372 [Elaphomyces granulatus]